MDSVLAIGGNIETVAVSQGDGILLSLYHHHPERNAVAAVVARENRCSFLLSCSIDYSVRLSSTAVDVEMSANNMNPVLQSHIGSSNNNGREIVLSRSCTRLATSCSLSSFLSFFLVINREEKIPGTCQAK